ncbi:MAG: TRAP transporter small permease [Fusobacteriaceae bacterium]
MLFLKKCFNKIEIIMEYFGMFLLTMMLLIIGMQVISRYIFGFTPRWSEEVALILMVWFTFIGMSIGVKRGIHISIEYFLDRVPNNIKKMIIKFDDILMIIFGGILFVNGYKLSEMMMWSIMPSIGLPTTVIYAVTPISGALIIIYSLLRLVGIKEEKKIIEEDI